MTEPNGRPFGHVVALGGWRAKSRPGRPVEIPCRRADAFLRASDAEIVGSRSENPRQLGTGIPAEGEVREEDEFEKLEISCPSILGAWTCATDQSK